MRLPRRSRGVVLGLTTLVLSPFLAITLMTATNPTAGPGRTAVARQVAQVIPPTRAHAVVVPDLRDPELTPPATAAPTPAPTAAPAPTRPPVPAPKPVPTQRAQPAAPAVAPADPGSVIGIIQAAAARWGVSGDWMVKIARCESGLRPTAYNPGGPYIGLFQFLRSTFSHNGGTNIYDAADQADIAAKMLAHGQAHQWSCA